MGGDFVKILGTEVRQYDLAKICKDICKQTENSRMIERNERKISA